MALQMHLGVSARSTQGRIQGRVNLGHRGGGPLLQETSSLGRKATATNRMYNNDLEACGMKCCYFFCSIPKSNVLCFHCSQVSDSGPLGLLSIIKLGIFLSEVSNQGQGQLWPVSATSVMSVKPCGNLWRAWYRLQLSTNYL